MAKNGEASFYSFLILVNKVHDFFLHEHNILFFCKNKLIGGEAERVGTSFYGNHHHRKIGT